MQKRDHAADCTNCGKPVTQEQLRLQKHQNPTNLPVCSRACRNTLRRASNGGTCDNCGAVLTAKQKDNQKRHTLATVACSTACRNALRETTQSQEKCDRCGKPVRPAQAANQRGRGHTKLACSNACRFSMENPPVPCAVCREPIAAHLWRGQQRRRGQLVPACSQKCRWKLKVQDIPPKQSAEVAKTFADCQQCGDPVPPARFYRQRSQGEPYTCTPACARSSNNAIDWQAFFKSDEWQSVMDEVMAEPEDAA